VDDESPIRILGLLPTFGLINEAHQVMNVPEHKQDKVPLLLLLISTIFNTWLYLKIEPKVLNFSHFKDPYLIEIEMRDSPGEENDMAENLVAGGQAEKRVSQVKTRPVMNRAQQKDNENLDISVDFTRILRLKDICLQKSKINILNNFTATFMSNRINVLVGRNGSGKSTLLEMLIGLGNVKSGSVLLNDLKYFEESFEFHDGKVYLGTADSFPFPDLTVSQHYEMLCQFKEEVENPHLLLVSIFEDLDLFRYKDVKIKSLDFGTKKLVAFGGAKIGKNYVLMFDDLYDGLNKKTQQMVDGFLSSLLNPQTIVIVAANDLEVAERISNW
jgi:ABC-type multidrug transport system ATPase subunit